MKTLITAIALFATFKAHAATRDVASEVTALNCGAAGVTTSLLRMSDEDGQLTKLILSAKYNGTEVRYVVESIVATENNEVTLSARSAAGEKFALRGILANGVISQCSNTNAAQ